MKFDPEKISTLIQILNQALLKAETHRTAISLTEPEKVELRKHFNLENLYDIQDHSIIIFSKKK